LNIQLDIASDGPFVFLYQPEISFYRCFSHAKLLILVWLGSFGSGFVFDVILAMRS
jgi:hypothetical protein